MSRFDEIGSSDLYLIAAVVLISTSHFVGGGILAGMALASAYVAIKAEGKADASKDSAATPKAE